MAPAKKIFDFTAEATGLNRLFIKTNTHEHTWKNLERMRVSSIFRGWFEEIKYGAKIGAKVMLTKIDHIGIAVNSIEESLPYYREQLHMQHLGTEEVEEQKVKVAFLQIGDSSIELLEPTGEDSPIAKFLHKNGPGIHHIAYAVEDIGTALQHLAAQGVRLIDTQPRNGAHGAKIAFIHPKSSGGVLTELCQPGS